MCESENRDTHTYVAIIGDIVASRKLPNRDEVQQRLKHVLAKINELYDGAIAAHFTVTLGDEFQGLLYDGSVAIGIIETIEWAMYPVQFRFGIGIGTMSTSIDRTAAIGADGPAYHCAREAIEELKKEDTQGLYIQVAITGGIAFDFTQIITPINKLASFLYEKKEKWTTRQREIIGAYIRNNNNQTDAANALGIKQTTVSNSLKRANYKAYAEGMAALQSAVLNMQVMSSVFGQLTIEGNPHV